MRCLFSRSLRRWWVLRVVHYRRFFFWKDVYFEERVAQFSVFPRENSEINPFLSFGSKWTVSHSLFFVSSCKHINGRVSSNMQKKEINKDHKKKTNIYLHSGWYGCALFPYVSQVDDYSRVTVPVVTIHFSCLNFLSYIVKYNPIFLHRSSCNSHHPRMLGWFYMDTLGIRGRSKCDKEGCQFPWLGSSSTCYCPEGHDC